MWWWCWGGGCNYSSLVMKGVIFLYHHGRWLLTFSLSLSPRFPRRTGKRDGERRLAGPPEPGERAQPGGHGGRGRRPAGPQAPEGGLLLLHGQSPRQPQEEEEQEPTQVRLPRPKPSGRGPRISSPTVRAPSTGVTADN